MTLEGRPVTALVDTGASMSVIALSFVRGLGRQLKDIDFVAELADGQSVAALGQIALLLEVAGLETVQPFLVFEDLSTH